MRVSAPSWRRGGRALPWRHGPWGVRGRVRLCAAASLSVPPCAGTAAVCVFEHTQLRAWAVPYRACTCVF